MTKVRTTLTIDPEVLRAVKLRAARLGKGDSDVIEEALRRDLGLDLLTGCGRRTTSTRIRRSRWPPRPSTERAADAPVRAVLDANVLIPAVLAPRGTPARLVLAWQAGEFDPVVSPPLLA